MVVNKGARVVENRYPIWMHAAPPVMSRATLLHASPRAIPYPRHMICIDLDANDTYPEDVGGYTVFRADMYDMHRSEPCFSVTTISSRYVLTIPVLWYDPKGLCISRK